MIFAFRLENIINIETLYVDDNENVMQSKCKNKQPEFCAFFNDQPLPHHSNRRAMSASVNFYDFIDRTLYQNFC